MKKVFLIILLSSLLLVNGCSLFDSGGKVNYIIRDSINVIDKYNIIDSINVIDKYNIIDSINVIDKYNIIDSINVITVKNIIDSLNVIDSLNIIDSLNVIDYFYSSDNRTIFEMDSLDYLILVKNFQDTMIYKTYGLLYQDSLRRSSKTKIIKYKNIIFEIYQ